MELKVTDYLTLKLSEPRELIELINDEDKIDFMQSLACEGIIIKHVADQIIDGCTEDGYYGSKSCGTEHNPSTPLDIAIRKVAKLSSEVARKEIEALESRLKHEYDRAEEWQNKYYDIYHGRAPR